MQTRETSVKNHSLQFAIVCEAALRRGLTVRFKAHGQSMQPNLLDGDTAVVAPIASAELRRGDIALTRNQRGLLLHRVIAWDSKTGKVVTRGDASQQDDPLAEAVLGKAVAIEREGKTLSLARRGTPLIHAACRQVHRLLRAGARRMWRWRAILGTFLFAWCAFFLSASPASAQADLAVTSNTAVPTTVAPGGQITYSQVVVNNGPRTATTPSVSESTPANTTFVSMALTGGTGTWNCVNPPVGGTGTSTCTRSADMGNGSTATFTYVVQINAGTTNGTVITDSGDHPFDHGRPDAQQQLTGRKRDGRDARSFDDAECGPESRGDWREHYVHRNSDQQQHDRCSGRRHTHAEYARRTRRSSRRRRPAAGWTCGTVPAVGGTGTIACTANGTLAASTSTGNFTIVVAVDPSAPGGSTITNTATGVRDRYRPESCERTRRQPTWR